MRCISIIIIVVLVSSASIQGVFSFGLVMEPSQLRVGDKENVTIMCQADVSLSDCQFNWWDFDEMGQGKYLYFKDGQDTKTTYLVVLQYEDSKDNRLNGYEYAGSSLENGQCGIQLLEVIVGNRVLSCRARSRGGSWNYRYMSLYSDSINLKFEPFKTIVLPGKSVSFVGSLENPSRNRLLECTFEIEGMETIILNATNTQNTASCTEDKCWIPNTSSVVVPANVSPPDDRSLYFGTRFQNGQCGVAIQGITEQNNGWVGFQAEAEVGGQDSRMVHLTVAIPPASPSMVISNQSLDENEEVIATCSVEASRPVSSIKWVIGNNTLRDDNMDDTPSQNFDNSTWLWDHERLPILQTLVFTMKREYDQKELECVVNHTALLIPIRIRKKLTLTNQIISVRSAHSSEEVKPTEALDDLLWIG